MLVDKLSIIIKSDNENSIKSVADALARHHGGKVVPELSAKGESQSNGRAEEAGKTTRGFARVMEFQVQEKFGVQIEEVTPVLLWMVRWAAMMVTRFLVRVGGKTEYEKGRK